MACFDCPRMCKAGSFCGKEEGKVRIAKVMRHFFEEPIICEEKRGCGAVFFSYCSLRCAYCQNYPISHEGRGIDYDNASLKKLVQTVAGSDVTSLDLVTPTHYTSVLLDVFSDFHSPVPVVWNTSGYERSENIEKLSKFVDIFLFDFKYCDNNLSIKYSKATDYFDKCMSALKAARRCIPEDIIENGVMRRGIIVRHLVLPGHIDDSVKIFEKIKEELGTDLFVSVMSQFSPCYKAAECGLDRPLLPLEYKKVKAAINRMGFDKGFFQEISSASLDYTPDFDISKHIEL